MSKNHDFGLESKIPFNVPIVIQIRNFLNSIVSEYEIHAAKGDHEDTRIAFERFSAERARDYIRFVQKWVIDHKAEEKFVIFYEDFYEKPFETIERAIRIFDPELSPTHDQIYDLISRVDGHKLIEDTLTHLPGSGIHSPRKFEDYKHFDPDWFDTLRRMTDFPLLLRGVEKT